MHTVTTKNTKTYTKVENKNKQIFKHRYRKDTKEQKFKR